jgi:hypothetical protein
MFSSFGSLCYTERSVTLQARRDMEFSPRLLWRQLSSAIWRHEAWNKVTDFWHLSSTSVFRVGNRNFTLPPPPQTPFRFHATSQKTDTFTAVDLTTSQRLLLWQTYHSSVWNSTACCCFRCLAILYFNSSVLFKHWISSEMPFSDQFFLEPAHAKALIVPMHSQQELPET